jgi:membrane associated rhomboid family serine protease
MLDSVQGPSRRQLLGYVPVTVVVVVVLSGYLEVNGIRSGDIYGGLSMADIFNPVYHATNMLVHEDWGHFAGNMRLLVPFGVLLTWLTSNRHVLVLVVATNTMANVVSGAAGQLGVGASSVAFGIMVAVLVRSTGYALQNASEETLQGGVAVLYGFAVVAFLLILLGFGGRGNIGHLHHAMGVLFAGGIEALYVFEEHHETGERSSRDLELSRRHSR